MGEEWVQTVQRAVAPITPGDEALRRKLLDVLLTPHRRPKMSYEEFLAWADEDTLAEWVDGEAVMTSPASNRHQDLARFLSAVMSIYVETR
ncbi:MAG: hypothetical protein JW850_24285, partial [Thermoflexales bacterium]|nr:hypothetical protein [Thermoflexales bacterium]